MTSTTAEWLLEIGGLTVGTRGGEDVVARGHLLAAQVRAAAAAHLALASCTAEAVCGPGCALAEVDGGPAACRLARRLAPATVVEHADRRPAGAHGADGTRAALLYVQALKAAATAVFNCRHAHAAGECWFSVDGTPMCGDVLAVAHRLGC